MACFNKVHLAAFKLLSMGVLSIHPNVFWDIERQSQYHFYWCLPKHIRNNAIKKQLFWMVLSTIIQISFKKRQKQKAELPAFGCTVIPSHQQLDVKFDKYSLSKW